jgi:hypothetical protein
MAHILSVPFEFQFHLRRAHWMLGRARPIGFPPTGPIRVSPVKLEVVSPRTFRGITERVPLGSLPTCCKRWKEEPREVEFDVLLCSTPQKEPRYFSSFDAWQLRSSFLALKQTSRTLVKFLNMYGNWDQDLVAARSNRDGPAIIPVDEIWMDQQGFKQALSSKPTKWLDVMGPYFDFVTQHDVPHFVHIDNCIRDAIRTTITIDFLRNVRFRICPRVDCGLPFPADRKGKRYCSQYCAHLVSLRKIRKKEKSARKRSP